MRNKHRIQKKACSFYDQTNIRSREDLPGKIHWNNQLGPAPAAVDAVQSLTNSVVMAALASHRKGLSAREKIVENGSLQLEICYLVGPPSTG